MSQISTTTYPTNVSSKTICSYPTMATEINLKIDDPCLADVMNLLTNKCDPNWWFKDEMLNSLKKFILITHPDKNKDVNATAWFRKCMEVREMLEKFQFNPGHILAESHLYNKLGCCTNHLLTHFNKNENETNSWEQFLTLVSYYTDNRTLKKMNFKNIKLKSHSDAINYIVNHCREMTCKISNCNLEHVQDIPYEQKIEYKDFDPIVMRGFAVKFFIWIEDTTEFEKDCEFISCVNDLPQMWSNIGNLKSRMTYAKELAQSVAKIMVDFYCIEDFIESQEIQSAINEKKAQRRMEEEAYYQKAMIGMREEWKKRTEEGAKRKLENPKACKVDSDTEDESDYETCYVEKKPKQDVPNTALEVAPIIIPDVPKVINVPKKRISNQVNFCKAVINGEACNKPTMQGSRTACSKSCHLIHAAIRKQNCRKQIK